MKKWQKDRNYKRVKDENGNVIANIITVFGQDVEVSDEVFAAYSQMDRRERYAEETLLADSELSWERFEEDHIHIENLMAEVVPSAEDCYIAQKEDNTFEKLSKELENLEDSDRQLIDALFYQGLSVRAYAQQIGISHTMVRKRRNCILCDLKKYFSKN